MSTEKFLKRSALVLAVSITTVMTANAAVSRGRVSESSERDVRIESERDQAKADLLRNKTLLVEITQRTNLSSEQISSYFESESKKGSLSSDSKKAWNQLFNKIAASDGRSVSDFLSADITAETVSSFIRLRKAGMDESFHVTEKMLLDVQSNWTVEQRSNFARSLSRAAELAEQGIKQGKPLTNEQAFEKALSELGYLEKYRQGCRR